MRLLILLASIGAIVIARPEKYREKEDFEYSRSSSDDGTKAGFYGAQRGNMGGNYEHAHNMDMLAQHQMSSLVRQVDGELGSGANQRTGSVFTSGNSRGVYGSGMYDLSNLKGRNFEESHAFGGSHSSLSSGATSNLGYEQAASNSRYSSQSQSAMESSRYHHQSSADSASDLVMGGHQAESLSGLTQSEYDQRAANNYKYYSGSNAGYNSNGRYVSSVPTKVYIRPGQTVTIPISSQTYDASHLNAHLHEQNSLNSDAEVISSGRVVNVPVAKHYESSYKYKKEWEKHDTQTFATPTENPFPQNIEHMDNLQISQGAHQLSNFDVNSHSNSQLNKFNSAHANSFSTGSQSSSSHLSGYHSGSAAESQNLASSFAGSHSKDYLHQGIGAGNVVEDINSRPKHYHSSYSYHKAWERQGDPYVIVPDSSSGGSEVQSSQKFTAASENYGHSSSHHGSQYSQSQKGYSSGCSIDCANGHIRVARSYKTDAENLEQQSQSEWANVEDLGQQTQEKWDHLTDLGQQTQNNWENLGQETRENWDHLGDLTQQQQSKWENPEDLGQKTQNVWGNLENLSQQSQTTWDKTEDQQKENVNDKHKPQNAWDKLEDLEQKPNTPENVGNRPRYVTWHEFQNVGQRDQNSWNNGNYGHHVHHDHHQQNIGQDQIYKHHSMHDVYNQELENWKLMQSISQHLENKQRENYFISHGNNMNTQQGGHIFGHRHDKDCHHPHDAIVGNTNYHNSWNTFGQENVQYKHFSDFWNNQYANGDVFTMQQEPHSVPKQTTDNGKQDSSIHSFWDKLDKIDNTLQTQTERNKTLQTNSNVEKNVINNDDKEESIVTHPVDVGRGDIGAEDLTSESVSPEQHKNKDVSTVTENKESEYHHKQQNLHKTESYERTTTKFFVDLSVVGIENETNKYNKNNENSNVNTEIENVTEYNSNLSNVEKINQSTNKIHHNADHEAEDSIKQATSGQQSESFGQHNLDQQFEDFGQQQNNDQQLEDFGQQQNNDQQLEDFRQQHNNEQQLEDFGQQQNNDQQLEDFGQQQNNDQQLEDFGQHQNNNQQLEDFKQPKTYHQLENLNHQNTDQQLEDFRKQQNNDQQLEDFGQQQNTDQQLEDFKQHNTDQQLEEFGQQQNTDQQLEDFKQHNTDQQLEDFGQQQNTDQQLEDFKQHNTDQQLEDFGQQQNTDQQLEDFKQQNTDQQLEDFGQQQNTDQQLEDFKQHNTDQQLEDFGQQQNTNQQLEDFKQPNTDQQLEDFGQQQNTNQQLEDFKQSSTDQQLEDFEQKVTDQQLETFKDLSQVYKHQPSFDDHDASNNGQQQQKKWYPEGRSHPHSQAFEIPKGRSLELASPLETVTTTTEKPGFWKSVGNKFTGAKNTVVGWFKS